MSQDKPWGLCLTVRSKKLQEKPLDVQFNSQEVFGYMPLPKESWFRKKKKKDRIFKIVVRWGISPVGLWQSKTASTSPQWHTVSTKYIGWVKDLWILYQVSTGNEIDLLYKVIRTHVLNPNGYSPSTRHHYLQSRAWYSYSCTRSPPN
jgi:hypothetical protein